jgi:hypothetical protein
MGRRTRAVIHASASPTDARLAAVRAPIAEESDHSLRVNYACNGPEDSGQESVAYLGAMMGGGLIKPSDIIAM